MQWMIFGAQGMARMTAEAIEGLNPDIRISCFVVSRTKNNASRIANRPVRMLSEISKEYSYEQKNNTNILIATPDSVQPEIEELLEQNGFIHYQRINHVRYEELVKLYMARLGTFQPLRELPIGSNAPFVHIFAARSHKDMPLDSNFSFPDYMLPIQAGAALTERNIAQLKDNTGDHISEKNGNYCELTALYWIWKNRLQTEKDGGESKRQYYGLAHYRRHLSLNADDFYRPYDNDVDVVLPYPLPYEPNIHAHHKMFIKDEDWRATVQALCELDPRYKALITSVFSQRYLFNCNIFLAKKHILENYCEWLFPLLFRIEELSVPKGNQRADRYIGYIAESLETLYFMERRDALKIVYADCREMG